MARIVGVDLPRNKRGEVGLTYIYGVGRSIAQRVLDEAGVDRNATVGFRCVKDIDSKNFRGKR